MPLPFFIIMRMMASPITSLRIVYSTVYSGADKKNIKAPRHLPLCVEFTGEFSAQRASNAENVSTWWRHRVWSLQRLRVFIICFPWCDVSDIDTLDHNIRIIYISVWRYATNRQLNILFRAMEMRRAILYKWTESQIALICPYGSGHEGAAVLLPGFAINW